MLGHLDPGTRLPTVRELATLLGVAPGTVARVYRELEHDGIRAEGPRVLGRLMDMRAGRI